MKVAIINFIIINGNITLLPNLLIDLQTQINTINSKKLVEFIIFEQYNKWKRRNLLII